MANIRIRTKSGEVVALVEARMIAQQLVHDYQPHVQVRAREAMLTLIDALVSALSVEEKPCWGEWNEALYAVRQSAGVIEEAPARE